MAIPESSGKRVWRQIAAVVDGKPIFVGRGAVLTADDAGYTITVNGQLYQRGSSKTDYQQTPHHSEVLVAEGPHAGETFQQIFTIEGDVLLSCIAGPGLPQPTTFSSTPGSGHTLSVWLRAAEQPAAPPASLLGRSLFPFLGEHALPSAPLSRRSWLAIAGLVLLASLAGSTAEDLGELLGSWARILVGGLAGTFFVTAFCRVLRWDWPSALTIAITIIVAANTFDELRKAVAPSLGPLAAVFVSGSTALVAAFFVAAALTRLFKLRA
jgi:uncharacterized protein (TIGR03067 family)